MDRAISMDEIYQVLNKTKTNKAPGIDRVPYEFLKNASQEFYMELKTIYNNIYDTGRIDDTFKETIIFPIFKKPFQCKCASALCCFIFINQDYQAYTY